MLLGRSQASCHSPSLVKALILERHASLTAYCRFQMPNEDPDNEADQKGSSIAHSARKYCGLLRVSLANLTVEPIIFLVYLGWAFGNTIQAPGLYRRYVDKIVSNAMDFRSARSRSPRREEGRQKSLRKRAKSNCDVGRL